MGTLGGHIIPGTVFCVIALWWIFNAAERYFVSQHLRKPYRSSSWYINRCCSRLPMECIMKLAFTSIGVIVEAITAVNNEGRFVNRVNAHHITMYGLFALQAGLEIALFYGLPFPPGVEYVASLLAFGVEGLLFYFHVHGRPPMDILVHMLLVTVIFGCAISTAIEMRYRNTFLTSLTRSYLLLLQGTWFYQVGFILYPPSTEFSQWDQHDHGQMMTVTMIFTWHCSADFVVVLCVILLVYWVRFRGTMLRANEPDNIMTSLLKTSNKVKTNGYVPAVQDHSEDSDSV